MTNIRLLTTTAAAVLLAAGIASAQDLKKNEAPTPAPAAQQKAPAEKMAPNMHAGQRAPETTGQATKSAEPGTPSMKGEANETNKTTGQTAVGKSEGANNSIESNKDSAAGTKENAEVNSTNKATAAQENNTSPAAKSSQSKNASGSATTGQGAAAGAAKLSTEQRTKITAAFRAHKAAPAQLNVSISVGSRIPSNVHLYPVPVEVVNIYPEWRGFDYILVGNEIIIVDPSSHEIVAVITA